jgi:alpha/beta superfamily hydrolase
MISEREADLVAGDGTALEARVARPAATSTGIAICHPHPLYGGDMDNPVVVRIAEVCRDEGLVTCRFNFRGVGRSSGAHDQGRAERLDAEAALLHVESALGPSGRLLLAGYSFGAVVGAVVAAAGRRLGGLILVAPPLAMTGEAPFLPLAARKLPTLIVAGTADDYCPAPALHALGARLPGARVALVEGGDHVFRGTLAALGETVRTWIRTP